MALSGLGSCWPFPYVDLPLAGVQALMAPRLASLGEGHLALGFSCLVDWLGDGLHTYLAISALPCSAVYYYFFMIV